MNQVCPGRVHLAPKDKLVWTDKRWCHHPCSSQRCTCQRFKWATSRGQSKLTISANEPL